MNIKNNQRFLENEKRIIESFLELLNKYDISKITVKAICEKSNINRSTFYSHYNDVYDLLTKLEISMNKKIISQFHVTDNNDYFFTTEDFFIPFLTFMSKKQNFYKACLKKRTSFPIDTGFKELFQTVVKPNCLKHGITNEDEMMYYLVFFQSGITMILKRWIDGGCTKSPTEICKYLMNCLSNIRKNL